MYAASLEAVKINLSSDSSCFVFKSRRVSIKQDLPVGLKVFVNVYTCPSSSIELAASFTKLLFITTRPHSQVLSTVNIFIQQIVQVSYLRITYIHTYIYVYALIKEKEKLLCICVNTKL